MGRTSKRSPERETAILNSLRVGNTRRAALAAAEISIQTFYNWLEDLTFLDAVQKAEAEAEQRFLSQVARAALAGTWQAAAWWLERRHPEDYALRSKVEMTGKDGGPIEHHDVSSIPDHEREALAEAIRAHLRSEAEPAPSPAEDRVG